MRSRSTGVFIIYVCMAALGLFLCGCTSKAELMSEASAGTLIVDETKVYDMSESGVDAASPTEAPEDIYVHVCGAVKKPGLYQLPAGSRVSSAVDAAGGFVTDADREYINLAAVLVDGVKIDIPTMEESRELREQGISEEGHEASSLVNLNTADETELQSINGIGPSKARAVVKYREEHGPFTDISEIMNVSGIGSSTFDKIKDSITI